MTHNPAPHRHAHPHQRRGRKLRISWLRQSAAQRLLGAGAAIVLLWAAVFWALP